MAKSVFDRSAFKKDRDYGKAWDNYKQDYPLRNQTCKCGSSVDLQRHHIIKASKVTSHAPAFIEVLCKDCHKKKHNHMRNK